MKIRLYNSKNDIVQVLALENGVLIRYDGNREIWCPNADCYLDDDYNLVVVSGPNGISMQITGEFLDWDCKMYVPACKAALELLFNSRIPVYRSRLAEHLIVLLIPKLVTTYS